MFRYNSDFGPNNMVACLYADMDAAPLVFGLKRLQRKTRI
jgi:hypothetical protein